MIDLVISHYNNRLDWILELTKYKLLNIIIYSKNPNSSNHIHNIKVIKRLNAGREGETYINYIIENYNKLDPNRYTIFVQDDPFEHQPNFIKLIKFLIQVYNRQKKLPLIQPLNSHAYQGIKKDMTNKENIINDDVFSYDDYNKKKEIAKSKGKQFFNNYPQKKANIIKTHSVFENNKQIAQINVIFINTRFDSLVIPDSNPFIWHMYKGINGYLGLSPKSRLDINPVIFYLSLFYSNNGIVPIKYQKRIIPFIIPYNPSAQFLVSNKLILKNDLFVYKNIQNVLLDIHQPILPQKVRLNGFILEFLWLHLFYFDKYYKNYFSPNNVKFYKQKKSILKDIQNYRQTIKNKLKIQILPGKVIKTSQNEINHLQKLANTLLSKMSTQTIKDKMLQMIHDNDIMKNSSNYNKYYSRL